MDWSLAYPWVSFNLRDDEADSLLAKTDAIEKQIEEIEAAVQKKYPELSVVKANRKEASSERDTLYKQLYEVQGEREKIQKLKLLPLYNLPAEFYKKRCVERDVTIFMCLLNRIYNMGGGWQITRDVNERQQKLEAYQKEIDLFADFLTDHYFNGE